MEFQKLSLDQLIGEIQALPSEWQDVKGEGIVNSLDLCLSSIQAWPHPTRRKHLEQSLKEIPEFLDTCRLFLSMSQDVISNNLSECLLAKGHKRADWKQLQSMGRRDPNALAQGLVDIGLLDEIEKQLSHSWSIRDVLLERFRLGRGRAISGQTRGRALEQSIMMAFQNQSSPSIPFETNCTYTGFKNLTAKCDFAIPTKSNPKIVIEAKGFEATGSKQTDVLGDIQKIIEAKKPHTYFFIVTDGRGWHRRKSDLKKIVEFHQEGVIDMIYTLKRLPLLVADVSRIYTTEM